MVEVISQPNPKNLSCFPAHRDRLSSELSKLFKQLPNTLERDELRAISSDERKELMILLHTFIDQKER